MAPDIWDRVAGQAVAKQTLKNAVERGRVSHSYLFSGPASTGKYTAALTLAAALLCEEGGCGRCNTCRRVLEGKHPDVTVVAPVGVNIPIETVRQMRLDAFKKPVEGSRRVYIIRNAERMREDAASTLLKVLEEPPGDVVFMLLTESESTTLPTIRSRCALVEFHPVPSAELALYLVETKGIEPDRADLIVRLTGGVLGRALDWCDEPWRMSRRDEVLRVARAIRRADMGRLLDMAGDLVREIRAPMDEIASVFAERRSDLEDGSIDDKLLRRISKELDEECKREQRREEARGVREILSTLAWWYRDILMLKVGASRDLLVNIDLEDKIAEEAEAVTPSKVIECMELIEESLRAIELNIPAQLNIESTLFGLQEIIHV
jgi:DNA polymerase-3 subunit delta'